MDAENVGAVIESKKSARERIFAVDRRAWARACDLGMPAAVSYLVLACGTGGDQRTTGWSVDAITRHTGIGRPRAKKAVQALRDHGLVPRRSWMTRCPGEHDGPTTHYLSRSDP